MFFKNPSKNTLAPFLLDPAGVGVIKSMGLDPSYALLIWVPYSF